jgi:hypothetical protein
MCKELCLHSRRELQVERGSEQPVACTVLTLDECCP